MPLLLVREDITRMKTDAIVNAANTSLLGGGGVDGAIHRAAGPELLEECRELHGCKPGQAKLTRGYKLPCRYVIHTVGPVWQGGGHGEEAVLRSCYTQSLTLAAAHGCTSVAFPLISTGRYGYPKEQARQTAQDAIMQFLTHSDADLTVYLVVFDKEATAIGRERFKELQSFVDDRYVALHKDVRRRDAEPLEAMHEDALPMAQALPSPASAPNFMVSGSLAEALGQLDESFSQMLLRLIDESGMTDAQCYKKANIDRKLFSKIRSDLHYHPKKTTAIAFALALELDLPTTQDLLGKAGFTLSHSSKFDIIIEYFITKKRFNILEINETLFAFDQPLLGA